MKMNRIVTFFLLAIIVTSCKKDDGPGFVITPPRDLAEVLLEDEAELKEFLETHSYNYQEFDVPPTNFDYKIKFFKITKGSLDTIALSKQIDTIEVTVASNTVGIEGDESIKHEIYYLEAREGTEASPSFADSTFVRYEGTLLDGTVFDANNNNFPIWFDLTSNIRGFYEGMTKFKSGGKPLPNPNGDDGTFVIDDYGIGAIFFPSALGYYSRQQGNISPYSPLIFKIDLYAVNETDHDGDGIPSFLEDVDGDGILSNDNTDEDFTVVNNQRFALPDYLDDDDDDDGTPTSEEIIINTDGSITFPDTDDDGTPDYRDNDNL